MEGKKNRERLSALAKNRKNVAKAEIFLLNSILHLKMEAIETRIIESENHFRFSIITFKISSIIP